MTGQVQRRGTAGILGRGVGFGAMWGAAAGIAIAVAMLVGVIGSGASPLVLVVLPLYCGFAPLLGAFFGVTVATMVSISLIVAGASIRRDRLRSRLLAGAVAAIPGLLAISRATSVWLVTVPIAIAAVIAAVALAPRVAVGKATAAAIRERVTV